MQHTDPEWQKEKTWLTSVLQAINTKRTQLQEKVGDIKEDILSLRTNFWDDVTVNMAEMDDILETHASLKQQSELLQEKERGHGHFYQELRMLDRMKDSPYFGRIDFQEDGESDIEAIYIGIASLRDAADDDFLVYDWRAPIASMYYDYAPGRAAFDTPSGRIAGDMSLKRQYIIKNQQLDGLFDTGMTIGDRLLQEMLGGQASEKMKSIVATIQKEQNQIIRNEKATCLVVQGAAGSGKTSAALQRVAYLLYAHRASLTAENMVLFSPNDLFNSYVSTVLPDLGEQNMQQTTYLSYAQQRLGDQFYIETPFEQLEGTLTGEKTAVEQEAISYKSSLVFKSVLDDYVQRLAKNGLAFHDIYLGERVIIPHEVIAAYFYDLEDGLSLPHRMEQVSEWLLGRLSDIAATEKTKNWVEDEIELLDEDTYYEVFQEAEEQVADDVFSYYEDEEDLLRQTVINQHFTPIETDVRDYAFVDVATTYALLFTQPTTLQDIYFPGNWEDICRLSLQTLDRQALAWEDVTPYLYFNDQLKGQKRTIIYDMLL